MPDTSHPETRSEPVLKLKFLSHGTVESRDIQRARQLYEEVFGFEVRQTSATSLMMRLNSVTTIACVETKGPTKAGVFSHFGMDVATRDEVDAAYKTISKLKDELGLEKVTKPVDQHGTYSFYTIDFDGNWWEILTNPDGGYSYIFDLNDEKKTFREMKQGRDRIENWQKSKAKSKPKTKAKPKAKATA
jgi:catechol 2,3-dioxygenase-like lactoylglutathione lyase family enzyme